MRQLEYDMKEVEKDLAAAEPTVRFDRNHLAAVRHCARRFLYVAQRERFLDATGRALEGHTYDRLPVAERDHIARGFDRLANTAAALQGEFRTLWLSHNRPEGLEENELRLGKQATMLRTLRDLSRRGVLKVDDTYSHMQARTAGPDAAALEESRR
jgi:hypothetical protein